MGQKINPIGLRLALNKNWCSRWFARKDNFGTWLHEDRKVRTYIKKNYNQAAISNILIERYSTAFAPPSLLLVRACSWARRAARTPRSTDCATK